MRDVRHAGGFLPMFPLDIAIVRETIHKRTEYEASDVPAHAQLGAATAFAPAPRSELTIEPRSPATELENHRPSNPQATNQGVLPPWTGVTVPPAEMRTRSCSSRSGRPARPCSKWS